MQEALLALETALLLNPQLAGAQLDYAQALALSGQTGAARDLAGQALQRPDVPPALQTSLQAALNAAQTTAAGFPAPAPGRVPVAATPRLLWSAYAQLAYGSESNVNNATSAQFLTLQLPNGPVTLPLADTERPRAAPVRKTQGGLYAALALPLGEAQLAASLADRSPRGEDASTPASASSSDELSLAYALPLNTRLGAGRVAVQTNRQTLQLARETQFESHGTQLVYDLQLSPCLVSPRLGQARQRYPTSPLTDGNYRFARLQLSCVSGAAQTLLAAAQGTDTPQDGTRPGGERQRRELLLRRDQPLAGGAASLWARWHHTQDAQPYSPLFGQLTSSTATVWVGLGYWVPLGQGVSVGLELEHTRQTSNNALFELSNQAAYLGLRWATR